VAGIISSLGDGQAEISELPVKRWTQEWPHPDLEKMNIYMYPHYLQKAKIISEMEIH